MSYTNPDYLATLSHLGQRRDLSGTGTAVFMRPLPQGAGVDAIGPYPWMSCDDEAPLPEALASCDEQAVSVVTVLSPLNGPPGPALRAAFTHKLRPFKTHWLCDFASPPRVDAHHRRQARRAQRSLVLEIASGRELLDDFPQLYARLAQRHALSAPARFCDADLRLQLRLPGLIGAAARLQGELVAAQLWIVEQGWAVYHLGASSEDGYRHAATHGLMDLALEHFRGRHLRGIWLGGSAGNGDDAQDGLARYKRGWANALAQAWIGCRVGQPERYRQLSANFADTGYFPAYRTPPAASPAHPQTA